MTMNMTMKKIMFFCVLMVLPSLTLLLEAKGEEIGVLKWKYETGWAVDSSPALGADGTIYVGSRDNYLYAINPDGSLGWRFETGDDIFSSPVLGADGTIYVGSDDNYLYAINPDGSLRWRFETGFWVRSS